MDRVRAVWADACAEGLAPCFVARLRRADEQLPLSCGLGLLGALCAAYGLLRLVWEVVFHHPYLLALGTGLCLLAVAAVADHRGLARLLPDRVEHYLLQRTPFDLLVNEPKVTDCLRRWGRVLLLCQERSDEEIQTIIRNLDPAFLDMVFRRSLIDALPAGLQLLLRPAGGSESPLAPGGSLAPLCGTPALGAAPGVVTAGGVGSLVAAWRGDLRTGSPAVPSDLSAAGIKEFLRRKTDENKRRGRAAEPALGPVVKAILRTGLGDSALAHNLGLQRSLHYSSVCSALVSGASLMWAWFFYSPRAYDMLRSMVFRGDARGHQRARGAAAVFTGLSLVGAGFWLVCAMRMQRQSRRATALPPTRGEVRKITDPQEELMIQEDLRLQESMIAARAQGAEPESEVSPENSSEDESSGPVHRR